MARIEQGVYESYMNRGLVVPGSHPNVTSIRVSEGVDAPFKDVLVVPIAFRGGRRTIFVPQEEMYQHGTRRAWLRKHTTKPV